MSNDIYEEASRVKRKERMKNELTKADLPWRNGPVTLNKSKAGG